MRILEIKNLKKNFQGRVVVENISFYLEQGEIVALIGPNGAGKTTAFYMVMGLIQPDAGSILLEGKEISRLPLHKRAALGLGYLPQESSIFLSLSVEENILALLELQPLSFEERKKRLKELLAELHLAPFAQRKAALLSGGERRRLEFTMSLVKTPKVILLDEPFANIDPLSIADVKQVILFLKKKGISVLITDHNARELFSIVDRSYLIQKGRILAAGSPQELLLHPEARQSYFGKDFAL